MAGHDLSRAKKIVAPKAPSAPWVATAYSPQPAAPLTQPASFATLQAPRSAEPPSTPATPENPPAAPGHTNPHRGCGSECEISTANLYYSLPSPPARNVNGHEFTRAKKTVGAKRLPRSIPRDATAPRVALAGSNPRPHVLRCQNHPHSQERLHYRPQATGYGLPAAVMTFVPSTPLISLALNVANSYPEFRESSVRDRRVQSFRVSELQSVIRNQQPRAAPGCATRAANGESRGKYFGI